MNTKKMICVVLAVVGIMTCFSSCSRKGAIDVIEKKLEDNSFDVYNVPDVGELDEVYYDYGEETTFIPQSAEGTAGISGYMIHDNKYYYSVRTKYDRNQHLTGISIMAYTDLTTGEKRYVCPDPLCAHAETWECPYVNKEGRFIHDGYMYGYAIDYNSENFTSTDSFWRIDLTDYSIETLYSNTRNLREESLRSLGLPMGSTVWDGKLYFWDWIQVTDEEKREETKVYHLWYLDLATKEAVCVTEFPEGYEFLSISFIADGRLYCNSDTGFISYDLKMENPEIIADQYWSMQFYDADTGELYYLIRDDDAKTGTLYVYKDGTSEKLELPHENIYTFQLTDSKIYYSPYEMLVYGTGARSGEAVGDFTGGKIYAIDRNLSGEASLIYDGGRNFRLQNGWLVLGDHLYFDYYEKKETNGSIYFNSAFYLKKVRIDLKAHTIKYMRFD